MKRRTSHVSNLMLAMEENLLFPLSYIKLGTCEFRRLNNLGFKHFNSV